MARLYTLDDLQQHFDDARAKLTLDRNELLVTTPLSDHYDRDEYGFSYLRAERIGMDVITQTLDQLSWMPVHLDPKAELITDNKEKMRHWLASGRTEQPDSTLFGNDFIHALTRVAIKEGWQSQKFRETALGIGKVFHDLSCLLGLIYYNTWLAENGVNRIQLTDPRDAEGTLQEMAVLSRSVEMAEYLYQRKIELAHREQISMRRKRPELRLIVNQNWGRESQLSQ